MNGQELEHIDYHLLGKYLAGEATPEEAMVVDEWLHLPANKKHYEELEKIWNGLPGATPHRLPERMAAWNRLQPALAAGKRGRVIRERWFYWAAAALVLILGTVVYFSTHTRNSTYLTEGPSSNILRNPLPDGSRIVINRNSVVRYSNRFGTEHREISLQGESYFEVTPDKEKPFIIQVGNVKIKVIGTSFNVRQTPDQDTVEVQVQSGLVKMYTDTKELAVAKGQTGLYLKATDQFMLKDSIDVNHISYATREFIFYNLTLSQLIPYLEDAYGVRIVTRNKELLPCTITGRFAEQHFEQMLHLIGFTLKFTYTKEGNTYYLDGEGCN